MRKFTFLTFVWLCVGLLVTSSSHAQKGKKDNNETPKILKDLPNFFVNDNVFPPYLKKIYKVDATRLAIRLLSKEQRLSKQTVKVPEDLVQSIYNALVAVRLSDYSAVDTIASIYYIRSYPTPNVEHLTLMFEHDAPWIEPLKRKVDTTASPSINRLIREHNLMMTKMVYVDEERGGLTLQSREPINIPALTMKFFSDEGILAIEETLPYGDGNDININRTAEGWEITYSLRFGNCVNQCDKIHDWKFAVSASGEVSFLGSSGHSIPPWLAGKVSHMAKKYPDQLKK
jgi:hypothetical protein